MFVSSPIKFSLIFSLCWPAISEVAEALPGDIVINEIHYQPDDESATEFIEIYNSGTTPVALGGWQLSDAVTFTFPQQDLEPGAFIVVAADPALLLTEYGVAALGPWVGKLSNDGERILLLDAIGAEIDQVDYGTGFPWPTAAGGGGQSMELIHPSLDNDLGGSWRSSVPPDLLPERFALPAAGTGWRWRPGDSEASGQVGDWRKTGFQEDASWKPATLPIGFGGVGDMLFKTSVTGMRGSHTSLFLRNEFIIDPGKIPPALQLRFMLDDGFILWVNGIELHRENMPGQIGEEPALGDVASSNYSETASEVRTLEASGSLVEGVNTVSIQLFNANIDSSDLGLDFQLISLASGVGQPAFPTPGAVNSNFATQAAPQVRQVLHSPLQPATGEDVLITARVTDPDGVSSVNLEFQLVEPGNYIRGTDFAYKTRWTAITMVDNGLGGDQIAGDSIFTVAVPGALQRHRRLTRYRIIATDQNLTSVTVPYRDDPSANFAYFTYDGAPAWKGAYIPGQTETLDFDETQMNSLPIYHLISDADDVSNCQYNPVFNDDIYRWEGTLVYDGVVYDHIRYRIRGADSAYNTGKNKWKMRFNRGHYFQGRDDYGRAYREKVRTLNWSALASPWNPANRGAAGLDEALAFRFWERAGSVSRNANYFHLRVIDGVAEQNPANQFDGDNWGLFLAIDHADRRFLDERGLPDGNTFNMHFNSSSLINKASGQPQDRSDLFAFTGTGADGYNRTPVQPASWWEDHVDLPGYFSYRSVVEALNHSDLRDRENSNLYHNPVTGKWTVIPWDADLLYEEFDRWGPNGVEGTAPLEQFRKSLTHPALNIRFQNHVRELGDLLLNNDQGSTLVDELVATLGGTGGVTGWAELDAARWNQDPRSTKVEGSSGNDGMLFFMNPYTSTRFPQYNRTLSSADFPGMVDWVKKFIVPTGFGGSRLAALSDDTRIPATPTIAFTGTAGFPTNGLTFNCSDFAPGSNGTGFASMQWRIGEVYNPSSAGYVAGDPWRYEVDTFWASDVLKTFTSDFKFPPIAVKEGRRYRARVRHQGIDGRWSHWSEPVEFDTSTPDLSAYLNSLVISEIMYKSDAGSGLEFIEIKNVGSTTLDLSDVRFTKGIDFDFAGSAITSIAPGGYVLVVESLAAFEAAYGVGLPVAGEYQFSSSNSLSNSGEQLKLSFGAGTAIRDFFYDDELPWPPPPDVSGRSLVLIAPETVPDHSIASNWRSSTARGGNPGSSDAALPFDSVAGGVDDDNDGLDSFLEHAFGGDDGDPTNAPHPKISLGSLVVGSTIDNYLLFRVRRDLAAEDTIISAEISPDLINWRSGPAAVVLVDETANDDGTSTLIFRSVQAVDSESQIYIRARARQRP